MLSFKPTFSLSSFTFIKRLFAFCHKGGIICISEVVDISSSVLDSGLIEPGIGLSASSSLAFHMMYSACKLNKQGDDVQL